MQLFENWCVGFADALFSFIIHFERGDMLVSIGCFVKKGTGVA